MPKRPEVTSKRIASLAGATPAGLRKIRKKLMRIQGDLCDLYCMIEDEEARLKAVAMSALTQTPDKPKGGQP